MITDSTKNYTATVTQAKIGESCQFRIQTKCGYPRMQIQIENLNPSDYDVAYGFGEWTQEEGLNATLLKKQWFRDKYQRSQTLDSTQIGTWLEFKNGVDGNW